MPKKAISIIPKKKGGKQQKGAGTKKYGRNKIRCVRYKLHKTREKHKIVRVAKSSGREAALEYATKHELLGWGINRLKNIKDKSNGNRG